MSNAWIQNRRLSAPEANRTVIPALASVAVMITLVWLGTWLFELDPTNAIAGSLAIMVLGLMVIAARIMAFHGAGASVSTPAQDDPAGGARPRLAPADRPQSATAEQELSAPSPGKRWTLDVFNAIDAQRFAAVCETWFSWAGFDTRSESHRTREGVDIWLHAAKIPGAVAIVRCKHGHDRPVEIQELREFLGLVGTCKSAHGTFTTTSTYTQEALQFARENGIDAVDGKGLLRKFQTRTRQRQQALLAVALNGQC